MTSSLPDRGAPPARFGFAVALPWVLRLGDGVYHGRFGPIGYAIELTLVERALGQPPAGGLAVTFNPTTGELGDVSKGAHVPGAMLRYSLVSVIFTKRVSAIPVPHDEAKQARVLAHQFLNHFLDLYRFTARDSAVLPLTWGEFHEVRAGRALLCTMVPDDPAALSQAAGGAPVMRASYGVVFRSEDPVTARFGPRPLLDEANTTTFRENLSKGLAPNLPALLLLNAEHCCAACDFRLAVIDASAALDIIVQHVGMRVLAKQGLAPAEATARLERLTTLPTVRDILIGAIDLDIAAESAWQAWVSQHRHLRNRVIHDGYQPTEAEAREALRAIARLTDVLDGVVVS